METKLMVRVDHTTSTFKVHKKNLFGCACIYIRCQYGNHFDIYTEVHNFYTFRQL